MVQQDVLDAEIQALIQQEQLPHDFATTVLKWYFPIAHYLAQRRRQQSQPLKVLINGAQGTGKSTLASFLQRLLESQWQLRCAKLSLDDLYLTRAERSGLATDVHPLLQTRGVPGTHDLELGQQVIDGLCQSDPNHITAIPVFDKSQDDRAPVADFVSFQGQADVVLLEGWCVGARAVAAAELVAPINSLEANEDSASLWRGYVNDCLKQSYMRFFAQFDALVMLKAPSMECVIEWRTLQEEKLRAKLAATDAATAAAATGLMSPDQIQRFVMHYERITRAMLAEMPARADVVLDVAADHSIAGAHYRD